MLSLIDLYRIKLIHASKQIGIGLLERMPFLNAYFMRLLTH